MPSTDAMMGGGSSVDVVVETGSPTGDRAEDRVEDGATEPQAAGPFRFHIADVELLPR
jgi:hypothetical protein